jgi:hypothetical protein
MVAIVIHGDGMLGRNGTGPVARMSAPAAKSGGGQLIRHESTRISLRSSGLRRAAACNVIYEKRISMRGTSSMRETSSMAPDLIYAGTVINAGPFLQIDPSLTRLPAHAMQRGA